MGMFDTFHFRKQEGVCCAAGHLADDLQTKSLNSDMDSYYIVEDQLYVLRRRGRDDELPDYKISKRKDGLVLVRESDLEPVSITQTVGVHGTCRECVPVFTRSEHTHFLSDSYLDAHSPWVELELQFKKGKLVRVMDRDTKNQTREALRSQLAKGGSALLADDDPMVIEHMEKGK
jgi:hypothetical protein